MNIRGFPAIASELVDEQVGIVRYLKEQPRQAEDPDFFRFVAKAANTRAFCPQENFALAGGAAANRETAAAKALGEAVERYSAAQYDKEEFPLTCAAEADFACVKPGDFAFYSAEQYATPGFPYVPFDERTVTRWVPATDALTGEICHVPACLVYVPYEASGGERRFAQPISTGLALHCTPEEAAISAIAEVVERDAFTIGWQAALTPPRIRLDSLSRDNLDLVNRFRAVGDTIHLLDLTLDIQVCTILAVRTCTAPDAPALSVAASTALSPEVAIRKSLEELAHTSRYSWAIKGDYAPIRPEPAHPQVVNQVTHLRYWLDASSLPEAEFLWRSPHERDFATLPDHGQRDARSDFAWMVRELDRGGHRVLLVDVTSPDVAEVGLHVVRAIIPGLHPLTMGYYGRALGGRRLWTVPQKLGYPGLASGGPDNPAPHPYP
jgi:ribosomal protein S12 methylthiotransferase accessory factor